MILELIATSIIKPFKPFYIYLGILDLGFTCTSSICFLCFPGFEAGGQNTPSNIAPWSIIGDQSSLTVSTDRSSCFERNKVALRMHVLCDSEGSNICPAGGVGIYNPGFWGMVRTSRH